MKGNKNITVVFIACHMKDSAKDQLKQLVDIMLRFWFKSSENNN